MTTDWNVMRVTGIRGGEKYIKLTASSLVIPFSQRYGATGDNIVLTTSLVGINAGEYTIAWSGDNITLLDDENFDIIKYADVGTLEGNNAKITVTVTSKNVSYSDTVTLNKVYEEDIKEHLGIKDFYPDINDSGGALIKGDSFVLEETIDEEVVYTPYVYTGTEWVETTDNEGNVLPQFYDTLMQSATSIFENGKNVSQSSAAIWGYFKNLVATNAFIENLTTQNLKVGNGDGTESSGFRFRAKAYDNGEELATPIFDVYYNDSVIFSINAVNGNVNFGDDGFGNPLFYYEQSSKSIKSKGETFVIDSKGNLTSQNFLINNGLFKGQFETSVLKTLKGSDSTFDISAPNSKYQAETIVYSLYSNDFVQKRIYKCKIDEYPQYTSLYYERQYGSQEFYDVRLIEDDGSYYDIRTIIGFGSTSGTFLPNTLTISIITGGDELYMIDLPTTEPSESNRVWNDGGILKIT